MFAFGLLVAAFMSPYANHRTDRWGGSLENRLRFPLAVIDAVRARTGRDVVVGLRIPGDELVPGGLDRAQMREIAQRFDATGQIDYLNVIAGNNLERFARIRHWPPTPAPHGLFAELAAGIKRVVTVPVICVGRVNDPESLRHHPHLRRIEIGSPTGAISYPSPAALHAGAPRRYGPVPALGEHTEKIRKEFGGG